MAWNPDTYNQFKSERFAPFDDLLALIDLKPHMSILDLGCGTGELTRKLADALPHSVALGIDSSEEMLSHSGAFKNAHVTFEHKTIEEQLLQEKTWDLIFSNAAIQWMDSHDTLIPHMISKLNPGGQLAIQMPSQHHNSSNKILNDLAGQAPYKDMLKHWNRVSPVLETDAYAELLFKNGCTTMTVYEKIYPLTLKDSDALFNWVSGTALIPYLERLPEQNRQHFIAEYKQLLQLHFKGSPVFYPFKRIIIKATF